MTKLNNKFSAIENLEFLNSNRKIWSINRFCKGLTLVELVIAISMLGLLGAIAVPSYLGHRNKAKIHTVISELQTLEMEIYQYEYETGELPDELLDLGISALTDPWGRPYRYLRIDGGKTKGINGKRRRDKNANPVNSDYDLYSMGKDGKTAAQFTAKNARDDIVRANDGEYLGLAEDH